MIGLKIVIDRNSEVPFFKQLVDQLRTAVIRREIPEGTRLPSERELSKLLRLNRSVVVKAYNELKLDGLLVSKTGSGTYVISAHSQKKEFDMISWGEQLNSWATLPAGPARWVNLLKKLSDSCIRLDTGVPHVGANQVDLMKEILGNLTDEELITTLNYPSLRGHPELIKYLCLRMNSSGLHINSRNMLITVGTEEAIYLLFSALARPGETIVIENPTYVNVINISRMFQHRVIPVERNSEGLNLSTLENVLNRSRVKFIYTMSCSHNPTGANMPERKKEALVKLSEQYSVPIVDDTVFSEIQYDLPAPKSLKYYDTHNCVIEIGGISKAFAPGLRIGWIIADEALIERLIEPVRMISLGVPNFSQLVAAKMLSTGEYDAFLKRYLELCLKKRETTKRACYRHLPGYIRVNEAQGGNFFWLELPGFMDGWKLAEEGIEQGVAVAPGSLFTFDSSGRSFVRLNPLGIPHDQIEEGISRLSKAIESISKRDNREEGTVSVVV